MKNKIYLIFGIVILIGIISTIVVADVISTIGSFGKMNDIKLTILKNSVGLNDKDILNISYGNISCDNIDCWSNVYYPNIIQTEWRTQKSYCSKYEDFIDNETSITQSVCTQYSDYTSQELIDMRDSWTLNRLNQYADTLIQSKTKTDIGGSGAITINKE